MYFETSKENFYVMYRAMKVLTEEARMKFGSRQMRAIVVDPASIAMLDMKVKSDAFYKYKFEKDAEIGMYLDKIRTYLPIASKDQKISFDYIEEKRKVDMRFGNLKKSMGLLSMKEYTWPKVPNLNRLEYRFSMKKEELENVLEAASSICDSIVIKASPEELVLSADGDTDAIEAKYPKEDPKLVEFVYLGKDDEKKSDARTIFSLGYITEIVKVYPKETDIIITFGTDHPCIVEGRFADGDGTLTYFLAPRLEE